MRISGIAPESLGTPGERFGKAQATGEITIFFEPELFSAVSASLMTRGLWKAARRSLKYPASVTPPSQTTRMRRCGSRLGPRRRRSSAELLRSRLRSDERDGA